MSEFILTLTAGLNCNTYKFVHFYLTAISSLVFAQRSTEKRRTMFLGLRRLLLPAATREVEAASANKAKSFIPMTLLTSAEQRSGSDGSYHSRGVKRGTLLASPTVNSLAAATAVAATRPRSKTVNWRCFEFLTAGLVWGASIPDSEAATPINLAAPTRTLIKRLYKLAAREGESEFLMRTPPRWLADE